MSSKRPVVLMAVLLLVLGAYLALPFAQDLYHGKPAARVSAPAKPTVLPTANSISNFTVARAADGRWMADFDYAYTGEPKGAMARVFQLVIGGPGGTPINWQVGGRSAQPGTHHMSIEVYNPNVHEMYTTDKVTAQLDVAPAPPFVLVAVDQRIQWPDPVKVEVEQALAAGATDAIVRKAVDLIDAGRDHELGKARRLLQVLVEKSPRTDAAYIELARVAMKTQWNSSGLHDAETLLASALQVRPDSTNARILLGYVYAHQGRYKEAEPLFAQAAAAHPPNLWLWANWGELLAMQGKTDAAILKYREAVTRPPTGDTYDRARWDAYSSLLRLLGARQDIDGMEALLKQRAQEYAAAGCFGVDYARFLVLQRGDAAGALAVLRDSPSPRCGEGRTRIVQALVHYVTWAQSKEPNRAESLLQARAFEPASPRLFYALGSSDRGAAVARQLIAAGEKLDIRDSEQLDALAYALRRGDSSAARRLLRLGANPVAEIGPEKMPAALIPVLTRDFDSIRVMQRAGVDYTKLRYLGSTAAEQAHQQGDVKLLQLLDARAGKI